ncbi:glycoside hydrolase family 31 protein [Enterococcus nangangensis]|uniref:glycoside hydrolase family 31 protein n=1 Tax=Enterococcus nangangensis TaxID=2559926 RepID=UPI0010F79800|nr:glycoside hydrolase family 31 protein [Enterococcus nangangensis]
MKNIFIVGQARFTILTPQLVRIEYDSQGEFEDRPTQAVSQRDFPLVDFDLKDTEEKFEIITSALRLVYWKNRVFSAESLSITLKNNLTAYNNRWVFGMQVPTLKGTARTLDEADGAVELGEGIISRQGFALLDDSRSLVVDEATGELQATRKNQVDLYFFGYGLAYQAALEAYFQLTGFPPLLPRYALGNWWSRFWRYDENSYLAVLDKFEATGIPLSVSVIDMDWHLTDVPARFGSGWTGYTWNRQLFPQPEKFLAQLHQRGLKVSLNVHPAEGIRAFEESYPQVAQRLNLDPAKEEPAQFAIEDSAFRAAYFKDVHEPLEKQGVDFWWIDWQQGTSTSQAGLDPLWLLNHYHYQASTEKGEPLILSRYAGPGSHRYPVGFSGDTFITWASLQFQPYFTATAANIGYTWWSHDIGGHMHGTSNDELTVRWLQFGAFSPINRLHSSDNPFASKEPWAFKAATAQLMKEALIMRHQLLPYLYTMNVLTHEKGYPLVKPIYYEHPTIGEAYAFPNEYYFGTSFLALPITEKTHETTHFAKVQGYLPPGTWVDVFTGFRYQGGMTLDFYRGLGEFPLLVQTGTIFPMDPQPLITKNQLPTIMEWQIYPGADAEFSLIEDQDGRRATTHCHYQEATGTVTIRTTGATEILPVNRRHLFKVNGFHAPVQGVIVGSGSYDVVLPPVEQNKHEILFQRLAVMDLAYDLKRSLYEKLTNAKSYQEQMMVLQQLATPIVQGVLLEVLNLLTE